MVLTHKDTTLQLKGPSSKKTYTPPGHCQSADHPHQAIGAILLFTHSGYVPILSASVTFSSLNCA